MPDLEYEVRARILDFVHGEDLQDPDRLVGDLLAMTNDEPSSRPGRLAMDVAHLVADLQAADASVETMQAEVGQVLVRISVRVAAQGREAMSVEAEGEWSDSDEHLDHSREPVGSGA